MIVKEILKNKYNISADSIETIDGDINYSNRKYLISGKNNSHYILKVYTDIQELQLAKEEERIIRAIAGKLSFNIPETILNTDKEAFTETGEGTYRLQVYLDGQFLSEIRASGGLLFELGEYAGLLDKELSALSSDKISARRLFWDLQYTHHSLDKIKYIPDPKGRKIVQYYLNSFRDKVLPEIHKLRRSLIHGDLNNDNILVKNNKISGIIDFGDISESCLINEVAIASCYLMMKSDRPFKDVLEFIKGFHSKTALLKEEILHLPDLITSRICISLCNSAEKSANGLASDYTLVSEKAAWKLLYRWLEINPISILDNLLEITGFSNDIGSCNTSEALKRRHEVASHSLSLSYTSPIYMNSALFQFMYDRQGNSYLDAYNNIPHVGHSHPKVSEAIAKQQRVLNTNTRYLYDSLADYSELLLSYLPDRLCKVFFVNSGSAASDLAVRLARNHSGNKHLLVLEHGYHGNTSTGISISPYKFDGKGGKGQPEDISKLSLPNMYKGKYNSAEGYAREAIAQISTLAGNNIVPAAFIAEPISGCGGQVALAPGYLKQIYSYFNNSPTLMISDEVQVGFGRLGKWFWGFEMHEVEPDIVILGKPMGNGHPIGAVVCTAEIADSFANGMEFFSSFGGNPVSCEAARAVLEVIEEENLQENASLVGDYYLKSLRGLQALYPIIGDVRGEGLFIGIEFTNTDGSPATGFANKVKNHLKEKYILTSTDGPFDNVIKTKPPLCFNKSNVDRVIEEMDLFIRSQKF